MGVNFLMFASMLEPVKRFLVFLLLALVSSSSLQSADFNIGLHSNKIPIPGKRYGDVWGEGDIACLGIWLDYSSGTPYGVGIYDLSNPANPNLLSVYTSPHSISHNQFEHGVVRDRIGYFGSWSGGGVHIVSLTNPAAPELLSRITSTLTGTNFVTNGFNNVHTLFLERNFLYEAAHTDGIRTVKVFDVSNPFQPVFLQNITTTNTVKVHQITAATKGTNVILYTSGWGNSSGSSPGQTDIWDVTHVGTQPAQWLGGIFSGFSSHSSWPTPDGNTLVVCREVAGGEVTFYDISDPANPTTDFVITPAKMGLPNSVPHNPVIVSNLLFLSWYQNGIHIFDISNRKKPVRVGAYDTYLANGTSTFQGNWGVFPFLGLNKLLLSDIQTGLYLMDASPVRTGTNNYAPLLIQSPTNRFINQGASTTFTGEFTGSSLNYQWRFNGTNIVDGTASSYTVSNAQTNQSGTYSVVAFNNSGSVTSAVANLSIVLNDAPPTISAQPQSRSVYGEQEANFSISVLGGMPLFYQWLFNGTPLANATNSTLTVPSVNLTHTGIYSVLVTNSYGSAQSANAYLAITDSPYISGISASVGMRSAVIKWTTHIPADGKVDFGPFYEGSITGSSPINPTPTTSHSALLTGLEPGTVYNFQVISRANGTNYISGVYQLMTYGPEIIIDNTDPRATFSGTWLTGNTAIGFFGYDYRYAEVVSSSPNSFATFTPFFAAPGKYDVSVWHTIGSNRASNAPFTVVSASGSMTIPVNQRVNGGQWNTLALNVPFNEGSDGFVRLANNANGTVVMADAVRFSYSSNQPPAVDSSFPLWWTRAYFGAETDANIDHDGDGFTSGQEFVLGTDPNSSSDKLSVRVFRSGGTANVIVGPVHNGRKYTLQQRSNLSGSTWQTADSKNFNPISGSEGLFSVSLNGNSEAYYRIVVELDTASPLVTRPEAIQERRMFSGIITEPGCGPGRIYAE